jgi:small subunit ribosomal protein S17
MSDKKEFIDKSPKVKERPKITVSKKTSKRLSGVATKDSLSKTVPVLINSVNIHPLYKKRFVLSKKILAHTEEDVKRGQTVIIEESRRISKNKAWKVVSIKGNK